MGTRIEEGDVTDEQEHVQSILGIIPGRLSIEAVGPTYSAILVEAADTETAQPARRRLTKKQTANAAPKLILTRTAKDATNRTTTRTRRSLK